VYMDLRLGAGGSILVVSDRGCIVSDGVVVCEHKHNQSVSNDLGITITSNDRLRVYLHR